MLMRERPPDHRLAHSKCLITAVNVFAALSPEPKALPSPPHHARAARLTLASSATYRPSGRVADSGAASASVRSAPTACGTRARPSLRGPPLPHQLKGGVLWRSRQLGLGLAESLRGGEWGWGMLSWRDWLGPSSEDRCPGRTGAAAPAGHAPSTAGELLDAVRWGFRQVPGSPRAPGRCTPGAGESACATSLLRP